MDKRSVSTALSAVLVADKEELTRFALGELVQTGFGAKRVIEAESFEAVLDCLQQKDLALAILDLAIPGLSGLHRLSDVRKARPELKLVVLSASDSRDDILRCLAAGVHGYVVKSGSVDHMLDSLRVVLAGQIYVPPALAELRPPQKRPSRRRRPIPSPLAGSRHAFTGRQIEVLRCLEQGLTNKQIGGQLEISERTVKMHLSTIYAALGVHNRARALAVLRELRQREREADLVMNRGAARAGVAARDRKG